MAFLRCGVLARNVMMTEWQRMTCGLMLVVLGACTSPPEVIVITATFQPTQPTPTPFAQLIPTETVNAGSPVLSQNAQDVAQQSYTVQPGDTLSGIALRFDIELDVLQTLNDLPNPDLLEVGQVLRLPGRLIVPGSDFRILPDHRLVRAPGSADFDIDGFIDSQPGYIRTATDEVDDIIYSARDIVRRVSLEYSIDARLLLALLEYKGGWLSDPAPSDDARTYPLGAPASPFGFDRNGLYRQLTWAADRLNDGYYGWKLGEDSEAVLADDGRAPYSAALNAATVGVQSMFSQTADYPTWASQVSESGFYAVYMRYFGDPFSDPREPLVPLGLTQPVLTLPFAADEIWFYTGGWHGGWGSGSAWAAVDFAPPDERPDGSSSCYVSDYFATAAADGVIARSADGAVVLDLDGDGDESTGWTILYLHIASLDRIPGGVQVRRGDRIGRPSCEGGFSTGTHLHIARRYNGEWITASCVVCRNESDYPPFVMSDWQVIGLAGQEYQGFLRRGNEQRIAEQGRLILDNRVGW